MKIKIGKFLLTNDKFQFIVSHQKKHLTGKLKGQTVAQDETYHVTLEQAIENILRRKVLASKATTLETLLMFLKQQRQELQALCNSTIITPPEPTKKGRKKGVSNKPKKS